jgi:hypothetical protein
MTREELQADFHDKEGMFWLNSQGEPDIDYVMWLEDKVLAMKNDIPVPSDEIPPDPTAEAGCGRQPTVGGAEAILRQLKYNSLKNLSLICDAMEEFHAQQQPTAEHD